MYYPSDFGMWLEHRDRLMREHEDERLARLLRATRKERVHQTRNTTLDRVRGRVRALLRMEPEEEV